VIYAGGGTQTHEFSPHPQTQRTSTRVLTVPPHATHKLTSAHRAPTRHARAHRTPKRHAQAHECLPCPQTPYTSTRLAKASHGVLTAAITKQRSLKDARSAHKPPPQLYRADQLLAISDFEQSPSDGFDELDTEVWCVRRESPKSTRFTWKALIWQMGLR
jgi:hypothetical protein